MFANLNHFSHHYMRHLFNFLNNYIIFTYFFEAFRSIQLGHGDQAEDHSYLIDHTFFFKTRSIISSLAKW